MRGVEPVEPMVGGWTEKRAPTAEELSVWGDTVEKTGSHESVDLASLGDPVSVQTQVVAGTNYKFVFENGKVVTVFEPISGQLEVTCVEEEEEGDGTCVGGEASAAWSRAGGVGLAAIAACVI